MRALPFRDWDSRTARIYHSCFDAPPAAISTFEPTAGAHVQDAYRDSKLTHIGRAGTGFTARTARELWEKLHPLERVTVPFAAGRPSGYVARNLARWVEPKLVCKVEFRAWTTDRQLRHASFKGLREDKTAEEVVAEDTVAPARDRRRPLASAVWSQLGKSRALTRMPAANPFSNYRPDLTRPLFSADVPFHRRSHTNAPIVPPTGGVLMEGFEAAVLIVFGTIVLVTAAALMFRSW